MSHSELPADLDRILADVRAVDGPIVFLTGAGISAESGIPTFRGPEGFWTVGSTNYRPEELATYAAFRRMPEDIWAWYLYRYSRCRAAAPNAANDALVELEQQLGDDFLLITQNVDGLHGRAGSSVERTYQIHGNLDYVRCAAECNRGLTRMPEEFAQWDKERPLEAQEREQLTCHQCGDWLRPHVLWFDECYDEERYRFESSMQAAGTCRLLVVVGTSGATNLPTQVCQMVARRGAGFVVVDPEPSPFTAMADTSTRGCFVRGTAGDCVPTIAARLAQ